MTAPSASIAARARAMALSAASCVMITMATCSPVARPRWIMLSMETPSVERQREIAASTPVLSSTSKRHSKCRSARPKGTDTLPSEAAGMPKAGSREPRAMSIRSDTTEEAVGPAPAPRPSKTLTPAALDLVTTPFTTPMTAASGVPRGSLWVDALLKTPCP